MTEAFKIQEPHYNLRFEASHFKRENVKSTHYGIQSVQHLGPKIWNIVPQNRQNIRESNSLNEFKSLTRSYTLSHLWNRNKILLLMLFFCFHELVSVL